MAKIPSSWFSLWTRTAETGKHGGDPTTGDSSNAEGESDPADTTDVRTSEVALGSKFVRNIANIGRTSDHGYNLLGEKYFLSTQLLQDRNMTLTGYLHKQQRRIIEPCGAQTSSSVGYHTNQIDRHLNQEWVNEETLRDVMARYHLDISLPMHEILAVQERLESMSHDGSEIPRLVSFMSAELRDGNDRLLQGDGTIMSGSRRCIEEGAETPSTIRGSRKNAIWAYIIEHLEPFLDVHSILMLRQTCVVLNQHDYSLNSSNEICLRGFSGYDIDLILGEVFPLMKRVLSIRNDAKLSFDFSQCHNFKDISLIHMLSDQALINSTANMQMLCRQMTALSLDYCNQLTDNGLEILLATRLPNLEKLSIVCCRNENITGAPFCTGLSRENWPKFTKFNCSFSNVNLEPIQVIAQFIYNVATDLSDQETPHGYVPNSPSVYIGVDDGSGDIGAHPQEVSVTTDDGQMCSSRKIFGNGRCRLEIIGSRGSRTFLDKHGFETLISAFAKALQTKSTELCSSLTRRVQQQLEEIAVADKEDEDICLKLLMYRGCELLVNCPIVQYDSDSCTDVWTLPIAVAVYKDDINTCKLLIRLGARVNIWNYSGKSPLYRACELGRPEFVKLLLKMEQAPEPLHDSDLSTLGVCIKMRNTTFLGQLLQAGLQVNTLCPHIRTFKSPLYLACEAGSFASIRMLLENGADTNWLYHGSISVTMLAYTKDISWLPLFVKYGAGGSLKKRFVLSDVLSCAISKGDLATVTVITDAYPDLLQRQHIIWSNPSIQAARLGKDDILKALIERGADVNQTDSQNATAVHLACEEEHMGCLSILIMNNANLNGQDSAGRTPLYLAVVENRRAAVDLLLQSGCNPNISEFTNGETPLMAALRTRNDQLALLILEKARDLILDAKDILGRSACIYALYFGLVAVGEVILHKYAQQGIQATEGEIRWFVAVFRDRINSSCASRKSIRHYARHYRRLNARVFKENGITFSPKKRWSFIDRLRRKIREMYVSKLE
ncbi:ankyrin repeat-containing protein, putative [Babesia ovis]|uniref:Ankyrin repeat-containing protein, putative n=1 Tax=Babesia ovis TaxID=5869 RepID=A0A9W5TCU6_BABOV|nr:ankyrin repeat-containing protein, putative [Babesia ovis]